MSVDNMVQLTQTKLIAVSDLDDVAQLVLDRYSPIDRQAFLTYVGKGNSYIGLSESERRAAGKIRRAIDRAGKALATAADGKDGNRAPLDVDAGLQWIEENLVVPMGAISGGKKFQLMDWQREWIEGAYADGIKEAGLSVARGNAKTATVALLIILHLFGPWCRKNWRAIAASEDADKSVVLRDMIVDICAASGIDVRINKTPKPGEIFGRKGSRLQLVAADRNAGQSYSPELVIIDEYGLLGENKREFVYSLRSALGKRKGARLFGISIQGHGPMFRDLADRAHLPSVYWKRFSTPENMDITDPAAWALSNPSLGIAKDIEHMRIAAAAAIASPADDAYFRAHELNQDLDPAVEMIVGATQWQAIQSKAHKLENEEVVLGIDLGETSSLSAVSAVGLETGAIFAIAGCGSNPTLLDRGRRDGIGARYIEMNKRGELIVFPGLVTPLEDFMAEVFRQLEDRNLKVVRAAADSFGQGRLRQYWSDCDIRAPLEIRKTWQSVYAHADVQAFQRLVYTRKLRAPESVLLTSAIAASTLKRGSNGQTQVERSKKRGQNDALVALVLAVGLYDRKPPVAKFY